LFDVHDLFSYSDPMNIEEGMPMRQARIFWEYLYICYIYIIYIIYILILYIYHTNYIS